jgi:5'-nucleotidase
VIALTHMTLPNDQHLAANSPGIDIILGGHDHMYVSEVDDQTGVFIVKSGTDFEEFSDINI